MGSFENHKSKYEAIEDISESVKGMMEDLYQSGFDTVHEDTLREIENAAKLTEQYGMKYLSGLLSQLAGEISSGRHQMKRESSLMAEVYTSINEYLYLCRQKAAYDLGLDYYSNKSADKRNLN